MYLYLKTCLRSKATVILRIAWTCCCILATLSTMAWQLSNYYNGEEQQIVEYKKFNEIQTDRYPSLALCWTMTINEKDLKRYENQFKKRIMKKDYLQFLTGDVWDKDMLMVDYYNVTPHFADYVLEYGYFTSLDNSPETMYPKQRGNRSKPELKEWSVFSQKCIAIDIPFRKDHVINSFFLFLKSSIFGKGGRLSNPDRFNMFSENQFHLIFHYPNQLFRRFMMGKKHWPIRGKESSGTYAMRLMVENIDVLVRRNSGHKPCIKDAPEGAPEHDQKIIDYVMANVTCKPPYWNSTAKFAPCSNKKQLKQIYNLLLKAIHIGNTETFYRVESPCRSLERISFDAIDVEISQIWMESWISKSGYSLINDSVGIFLDFKEWTYKEVKSIRGMDIQALIGKELISRFNEVNDIIYIDTTTNIKLQ